MNGTVAVNIELNENSWNFVNSVTSRLGISSDFLINMLIANEMIEEHRFSDKQIVAESAMHSLKELQHFFSGEAERMGIKSDDDVMAFVKRVREEMRVSNNESK